MSDNEIREMTVRQQTALARMIAEARNSHSVEMTPWSFHANSWRSLFRDEVRPGRGHDIDLLYVDGEAIVQITLDPYGYGHICIGVTLWSHNSADDECPCDICITEREKNDE